MKFVDLVHELWVWSLGLHRVVSMVTKETRETRGEETWEEEA